MIIPSATNSLNSLGTFFHRENYKENAYPSGSHDPIDLWYEKLHYGRKDHKNNSIFISEGSLKQINTSNSKNIVFAANFVTDAFEDMRKHFQKAKDSNRLDLNSQLVDLEVKIGWKNVNEVYHTYLGLIFDTFVKTFLQENNRNEQVFNFSTFLPFFLEYINMLSPQFPFSRSGFIASKYCAPEVSGLVLQLQEENHALDKEKYEKYIQDPNFSFYVKTAAKFGFVVDKNAPWRLVADLASPGMLVYLKKYNLTTLNSIFDQSYYRSYTSELEVLKVYISQFYNSFVSQEPFISSVQPSSRTEGQSIFTRKQRFPVNLMEDHTDWNRVFVYIRVKETSWLLTQAVFDKLVKNANSLEKNIDKDAAHKYINDQFSSLPNNLISERTSLHSDGKIIGIENVSTFSFEI